jgi:NhaP-type Na+/H+ or K+/H+ antiporter
LFEKTRVLDVLLLVLIGLLIGPITGVVDRDNLGEVGNVFAIITLVIILFESGLGLTLSSLRQSMGQGVRLTVINFVATLGVVLLICRLVYDMSVLEALILGSIVGGTSSAVVIPMVSKLRVEKTRVRRFYFQNMPLKSYPLKVLCMNARMPQQLDETEREASLTND